MPWLKHGSGNELDRQLRGPGLHPWGSTAKAVEPIRLLKMWSKEQ